MKIEDMKVTLIVHEVPATPERLREHSEWIEAILSKGRVENPSEVLKSDKSGESTL